MRRPRRSILMPTNGNTASEASPDAPIAAPITDSLPPNARTCSGNRKNEAKFKKKKKFASVVNRNGPVSSRARIAEPYPHPAVQTRRTHIR